MANQREELLRYDGPVQRTSRVVLEDVEIGGHLLRAGDRAHLLLGAANRDPARFPEPDRLEISRTDNPHLTFTGGIHYCIGAPLARVEAQIAITTLLRRLPGLRPQTDDAPAWRDNLLLRGLKALRLTASATLPTRPLYAMLSGASASGSPGIHCDSEAAPALTDRAYRSSGRDPLSSTEEMS